MSDNLVGDGAGEGQAFGIFRSQDARQILQNKHIVVVGDSGRLQKLLYFTYLYQAALKHFLSFRPNMKSKSTFSLCKINFINNPTSKVLFHF